MAWLARSPPGYFTNSSILVTLGGVLIALVSPSEHDHSPRARTPTTRRTRDRMVRRTNRATANVHRCFFASACSATFKTWGPCSTGEWFTSVCVVSWHEIVPTKRKFGSRIRSRSDTSDPNGDAHYWRTIIIFQMFSSRSVRGREGTGLVEKRSIGLRVPRSPGGNRKLSRRIGQ